MKYFLLIGCLVVGCAHTATPARTTDPVRLEEMRLVAREDGVEAYDAETLFRRALTAGREGRCVEEGVPLYDRVAREFPGSRYLSPSLYNAALCLQDAGQPASAAERYERIIDELADSPDAKHASLQLVALDVELERWDHGFETVEMLLRRTDLSVDDRIEAMARKAQLLLGSGQLEEASLSARATIAYGRSAPDGVRREEGYEIATANFVLAESFRLRAEQVRVDTTDWEEVALRLERRASLILDAQREYLATIRRHDRHWSPIAGHRIGAMYDTFFDHVQDAPVPTAQSPQSPLRARVYRIEYKREMARQLVGLLRRAVQVWELTLMMIERRGIDSAHADRIRADLERVRGRLDAVLSLPPIPESETEVAAWLREHAPDELGVPTR